MITSRVATKIQLTINPSRNRCNPKKIGTHATFNPKWSPHSTNAAVGLFVIAVAVVVPADDNSDDDDDDVDDTIDDEILDTANPINVYNNVQTGPNNRSGGVQDGLLILVYHPPFRVPFTTNGTPLQNGTILCPTIHHTVDGTDTAFNRVLLLLLLLLFLLLFVPTILLLALLRPMKE